MTDPNGGTARIPREPNEVRASKRIGRYVLLERIGKGGMGVVYRARDTQLDRIVALKTIVTELADEADTRQRFVREARAAADLSHPNIIKVYDFGEDAGRAYIVMELLVGHNLSDLLADGKAAPLERAITIMRGVSTGMAFAHSRSIVHRDLKPGNIFLPDNGSVKVLDFGLARIASSKLTRGGLVFGTPDYMSPEQIRGKVVDHRSDIFSLGAVFYHLISGRKPFAAGSLPLVMRAVLESDPEALTNTSPLVARIIARALQKDPADRYQAVDELITDLDRGGEPEERDATVLIRRAAVPAAFPRIGRYRVVEEIGRGGMGVVYRARDPVLDRDVAIKSILGDFSSESDAAEQFEHEARAAAGLQHANIITIYELGMSDGSPYIVMEFLGGMDLEAVMRARQRPSLATRLDIVMQLCAGLSFAHRQGVVHRDMKPSNVRILEDGTVKLIDFGIARVSRSVPSAGDSAGSVACTAPEQLEGSEGDARSDVFGVGVLMYEFFGGTPPFAGDSPPTVAYQILNHEPPPLNTIDSGIPDALSRVVVRALEKRPGRRYEDAGALAAALAGAVPDLARPVLDGAGGVRLKHLDPRQPAEGVGHDPDVAVSAGDSAEPSRGVTRRRRHIAVASVAALALLVIVPGAGIWSYLIGTELPVVALPPRSAIAGPGAVLALTVESEPPGARILIAGGDYLGIDDEPIEVTTPTTLPFREAFPDTLELRRPGYDRVEVPVPDGEGPIRIVKAVLDAQPTGALAVSGSYAFEVWNADRRLSNAATEHSLRLPAGPAMLRLRNRELFLDQRFQVQIIADRRASLRAPPLGRLTIYSRPGNCEILIDGRVVGFSPIWNRRVAAGRHTIARRCPNAEQNATDRRTISAGSEGEVVRFGPASR